MKKVINAKIITPYRFLEGYEVAYSGGKIIKVAEKIDGCDEVIDAKGMYLTPGFIDLHIHGGAGFSLIEESEESLEYALNQIVGHGVTSLMASHMVPVEGLGRLYADYMKKKRGPEIIGLHAECVDWDYIYGDPINFGKEIPPYDLDKCRRIFESVPTFKRIGIDPCIANAPEAVRIFASQGIMVSISHCGPASYDQVMKCVEAGAGSATHLYTGMFGFYRDQKTGERFPGLIEDCLMEPDIYAEVIGNGKHLTGPMLKLIYQNKGADRMYLVTDAAARKEPLKEGEDLVAANPLPDRISIRTMAQMDYIVQQTYKVSGIPLLDVIRMATLTPAQAAKVDDRKGKICEGYDADFLLLNEALEVCLVVTRGRELWV